MEVTRESYHKIWAKIEPKPGSYKFGEKNLHKFIDFIAEVKFTSEDWDFWINKLGKQPWNKMEADFLKALLKYKTIARRVAIMNSITARIAETNGTTTN